MAVGVLRWSVVGVGVAGRARGRAILADPGSRLVAVHRGRFAAELSAPEVGLDAAIDQADAVAICSPTPCHADQVRRCLEGGRHVVVEFPLAEDAERAGALFALARARGRILHEEHIELLDPVATTLRAHVQPGVARAMRVEFDGPGPGDHPGRVALANVARLHRLVDVLGPVRAVVSCTWDDGLLRASVEAYDGARAQLAFRQAPQLPRATRLEVETDTDRWRLEAGTLWRGAHPMVEPRGSGPPASADGGTGGRPPGAPQPGAAPVSLFARDHEVAVGRILRGRPSYVTEERILHVLRVVGRLGALQVGAVADG